MITSSSLLTVRRRISGGPRKVKMNKNAIDYGAEQTAAHISKLPAVF